MSGEFEMRFPDGYAHCEKCQQQRKHHRVTAVPLMPATTVAA